MHMLHRKTDQNPLLLGLIAGAAGTVALNVTTYLDMAVRGRPASSMPKKTADKLASEAGLSLGPEKEASNRKTALGTLLGYVNGLAVGVLYAKVAEKVDVPPPVAAVGLGVTVMGLTDGSYTALGISNPLKWSAKSWTVDVVPHLIYGAAAAHAYDHITRP